MNNVLDRSRFWFSETVRLLNFLDRATVISHGR